MTFYYDPEAKQLREDFGLVGIGDALALSIPSDSVEMMFAGFVVKVAAEVADFFKPGKIQDADVDNIKRILEEGRASGAKEVEIEIEREVTQGLNAQAREDEAGVHVLIGQQGKSRYRIKMKY